MMNQNISRVLITGATGRLAGRLAASGLFPKILTPSRKLMDLCDETSVRKYFQTHAFDAIIHAAALARMEVCQRHPARALETNLMGTARLVKETLRKEKTRGRPIRFIYISTDGVYPSTRGHYKETDATIPYNSYGWTKLGGECAVHLLENYCIIRTRYFDPAQILFKAYTTDAYSSSISLNALVAAIQRLLYVNFVGTVNVGGKRTSNYACYKKLKASIKPCLLKDIQKKTPFVLSRDASLNCSIWKKIIRNDP